MNNDEERIVKESWDRYEKELPFKRMRTTGGIDPESYLNVDEGFGISATYCNSRAAKKSKVATNDNAALMMELNAYNKNKPELPIKSLEEHRKGCIYNCDSNIINDRNDDIQNLCMLKKRLQLHQTAVEKTQKMISYLEKKFFKKT